MVWDKPEAEATTDEAVKVETALLKMEGRTDWDVLHKAASDKWQRRFGIHAGKQQTWGMTVDWLLKKQFKVAQIMLIAPNKYFPTPDNEREFDSSVFKSVMANCGIDWVLHTPYVIQVAGLSTGRKVSAKSLKSQCKMAQAAGIKRVVVHASSPRTTSVHPSDSMQEVLDSWIQAVTVCNKEAPDVTVLIENPAWRNTHFSDPVVLAGLIKQLRGAGLRVGMCYDSAHHWAAVQDFDVTNFEPIAEVTQLLHYNDSPVAKHAGLDRHSFTPLGTGQMGAERLAKVLTAFPKLDCIFERDSWYDLDLEYVAKSM